MYHSPYSWLKAYKYSVLSVFHRTASVHVLDLLYQDQFCVLHDLLVPRHRPIPLDWSILQSLAWTGCCFRETLRGESCVQSMRVMISRG